MFNILCEEKILFGQEAFEDFGNVTLCKGNRLTAKDLKHIDILLIRSGTRVDHALLDGTPVQFVASATAGTDHVNQAYLAEKGIPFYHAPGCNADAVVEYVIASILTLADRKGESFVGKTAGIIGAGSIGGRLATRLPELGINVIVNDPPRYDGKCIHDTHLQVVSLDTLLATSDIVTIHTPLTKMGRYATHHLFDESRLQQMKPDAWLINAARGPVISNQALLAVLRAGHLGAVVLDVWENEPGVDIELLKLVDIATPHIAGHSYDGKVNGTIQIYESFRNEYVKEGSWVPESILQPIAEDHVQLTIDGKARSNEALLHSLVMQMYDIASDDIQFRQSLDMGERDRAEYFLELRKMYPRRRSFQYHKLLAGTLATSERRTMIEKGLLVHVDPTFIAR